MTSQETNFKSATPFNARAEHVKPPAKNNNNGILKLTENQKKPPWAALKLGYNLITLFQSPFSFKNNQPPFAFIKKLCYGLSNKL
jgi:hypothetical protein